MTDVQEAKAVRPEAVRVCARPWSVPPSVRLFVRFNRAAILGTVTAARTGKTSLKASPRSACSPRVPRPGAAGTQPCGPGGSEQQRPHGAEAPGVRLACEQGRAGLGLRPGAARCPPFPDTSRVLFPAHLSRRRGRGGLRVSRSGAGSFPSPGQSPRSAGSPATSEAPGQRQALNAPGLREGKVTPAAAWVWGGVWERRKA